VRASDTRVIDTPATKPRGRSKALTMWPAPAVRSPTMIARPRFFSTKVNSSAAEPVERLART